MMVDGMVAQARHKEMLAEAQRTRLVAQWRVVPRGRRTAGDSPLRLRWVAVIVGSAAKGDVRGEQAA